MKIKLNIVGEEPKPKKNERLYEAEKFVIKTIGFLMVLLKDQCEDGDELLTKVNGITLGMQMEAARMAKEMSSDGDEED